MSAQTDQKDNVTASTLHLAVSAQSFLMMLYHNQMLIMDHLGIPVEKRNTIEKDSAILYQIVSGRFVDKPRQSDPSQSAERPDHS